MQTVTTSQKTDIIISTLHKTKLQTKLRVT